MHRQILCSIGILEILAAGVMIAVGERLPCPESVNRGFDRIGQATHDAKEQVQLMRRQVTELRSKDFPQLAGELSSQTIAISGNWKAQHIDFKTVEAMSDALAATAKGLESWSGTLDRDMYLPAARSLGGIADLLDSQAAVALLFAETLHESSLQIEADFIQLGWLTCQLPQKWEPFALAAMRSACDLHQHGQTLHQQSIAIRNRLGELETGLERAIGQVGAIGDAKYPVVMPPINGPPTLEMRPVWPDGKQAAENLRKAHVGLTTLNRDWDVAAASTTLLTFATLGDSGPFEHSAIRTARKVYGQEMESVCDVDHSLSTLLRRTGQFREFSAGLRKTQQGLERTLKAWPELVRTMHRSADVLNGSRIQLDSVLAHRAEYERAVRSGEELTRTAENALDVCAIKLDARLGEQEDSLERMGRGLGEMNDAIPEAAKTTNDLLESIRWLFWLVGGLIGLHGLFVVTFKPLAA